MTLSDQIDSIARSNDLDTIGDTLNPTFIREDGSFRDKKFKRKLKRANRVK